MRKIPKKKKRPGIDEYGRNELHYAALENQLKKVRRLIAKGADVNALDDNGFSALHFAVQENNKEIVRILLDGGAIVDIKDSYGNTPLMRALHSCYAAMANEEPEPGAIIKMLLQAGANPNSENKYGIKVIDSAQNRDRDLKQFFESI
jgi:ankyrin repeat protein